MLPAPRYRLGEPGIGDPQQVRSRDVGVVPEQQQPTVGGIVEDVGRADGRQEREHGHHNGRAYQYRPHRRPGTAARGHEPGGQPGHAQHAGDPEGADDHARLHRDAARFEREPAGGHPQRRVHPVLADQVGRDHQQQRDTYTDGGDPAGDPGTLLVLTRRLRFWLCALATTVSILLNTRSNHDRVREGHKFRVRHCSPSRWPPAADAKRPCRADPRSCDRRWSSYPGGHFRTPA